MIPQPLRSSARPAPQTVTRMAAMAGVDLSQPITAMKDGTALRLDDWLCRREGVTTRSGYERVTEDHGGPITALMGYPNRVISATATALFEGQSAVATGQSSGAWQGALMPNPGGLHLVCVNGADAPRRYDGLTWAAVALTGVDAASLGAIVHHQHRLFMAERGSLRVWYLDLHAIGGPAHPIYLDALCRRGGSVAAIASLEPNGGAGPEAQLCIVTTEGELVVYAGTDPDSASAWRLVGVWTIPRPRGKRCFARMAGQLAVMTDKGVMSVPSILATPDSAEAINSLSRAIDPALVSATDHIVDSASADMTVLGGADHQWVRSDTGAWSRLTLPATVWAECGDSLYFGTSDGTVCRYGGDTDAGAPIRSFAVDAFSTLGRAVGEKTFHRVRMLYRAAHPYVPRIELLTNYRNPPTSFAAANVDDGYWRWPDVSWPHQPMAWMRPVSSELQTWRGISGHGHAAALMMSVQTVTPIVWTGYEVMFRSGGRV